jgi:HK97 gp10 family phage protein
MPDYRLEFDQEALAELLQGEIGEQVADLAGAQVAEKARALAPKRTGKGAASIHHEVDRDGDGPFANVGYDPDGFYMAFQELGTQFQPPQPHLRPAISEDLNL